MSDQTQEPPMMVSNMTYSELVNFFHLQMGRVEMTWFRVMYLHAAIVGVLAFFAEASDSYLLQRVMVFAFYTVNLVIFHVSLQEGYAGLRQAHQDLLKFPQTDGQVEQWFRTRRYGFKTPARVTIMVITWALIGLLLFRNWLTG